MSSRDPVPVAVRSPTLDELTPGLAAKVADEVAFGLVAELRVAMWHPSSEGAG